MPRINAGGVPSTGYCTTWFDETRTIRYNVPDGNLNIELSDGTHIFGPLAISLVYAGSGHWCAEQTGANGQTPGVLFDGVLIPGAALAGYCDPIGPDDSLIVKRVRDSFGPWGFVNGPDFGGDCRTVTNYGNHRAHWIEGAWVLHSNFGSPVDGTVCYNYRWKDPHFLYQSAQTGELVFDGHVIGPAGNYYRPDFYVKADGSYLIFWSAIEGEPTVISRTLTPADLAACQVFAQKSVTPAPIAPAPTPIPSPAPKPTMDVPASELQRLADALHRHESLLVPNTDPTVFIATVAMDLGKPFGLNGKRGNARDLSLDIITYLCSDNTLHLYDVIGDHGDPAVDWKGANTLEVPGTKDQGEVHQNGNGAVWVDPASLNVVTTPVNPPNPPQPVPVPPSKPSDSGGSVDQSAVLTKLDEVLAAVQANGVKIDHVTAQVNTFIAQAKQYLPEILALLAGNGGGSNAIPSLVSAFTKKNS